MADVASSEYAITSSKLQKSITLCYKKNTLVNLLSDENVEKYIQLL